MRVLNYNSVFSNNAVFILDGLKSTDLQTARHLDEELSDLSHTTQTPYCSMVRVGSRSELFAALEEIRQYCLEGVKPIIHIEAHGCKDFGIAVGDNQEKIGWGELNGVLGNINTITKNNLGSFAFHHRPLNG